MAWWPGNEKNHVFATAKPHDQAKEQSRNNLILEQGAIGSATLLEKNTRLDWAFATTENQHSIGSSTNTLILGKQVEIFPPTRPFPSQQVATTIHQCAEQGANFLRTYLPDVDISAELIRDQLVEEMTLSRELKQFDPCAGNLLGVHNTQDVSLLFFPMGETYQELNLCSTKFGDDVVFKPSAVSSHIFPTPIQQIEISKSDPYCSQGVGVAVRTYGSTKLFKLNPWPQCSPHYYKLTDLATLSRADVGDEVIVDMKHIPSSLDVLTVGDRGSIYQSHIGNGGKSTSLIHQNGGNSSSTMDDCRFWRLSLDPISSIYFLMSSKHVIQGDVRVKSQPPNEMISIASGKHILTSIEDLQPDGLLRLCSTNQIIWMDPRVPGKQILAYCHGRQYDRYLATETFSCNSNNAFTLLKTRNNGLTTVYDVSRSQSNLVSVNAAPYALSNGTSLYGKYDGHGIVTHDHRFGLVRLSERGELSYNVLAFDSTEEYTPVVEWTTALEELKTTTATFCSDAGPLDEDRPHVDLGPVYHALFRTHYEDSKVFEEQTSDATNDLVENFSSYWQTRDMPVEHVLTTYDIAFRAGDEPGYLSRADFLTGSIINSAIGYGALKQGRLSADAIKAPWHRSIALTLSRLDKGFQVDPKKWAEYLQQFDLPDTSTMSDQAYKYQCTARQRLELDLALSTDIFSEIVSKPNNGDQALEVMTEALSLCAEPPSVEFGYLRPLERKYNIEEGKVGDVLETPDIPMGVRLLLKHWGSGNPESYLYQDPYENPGSIGRTNSPSVAPFQNSVAWCPPPVIASKQANVTILPDTRGMKLVSQSQEAPRPSGNPPFFTQPHSLASQDLVSTQVLPGLHGGRSSAKKKKRMEGF